MKFFLCIAWLFCLTIVAGSDPPLNSATIAEHFQAAQDIDAVTKLFKSELFPSIKNGTVKDDDSAIDAGLQSLTEKFGNLKDAELSVLLKAWDEVMKLKPDNSAITMKLRSTTQAMLDSICKVDVSKQNEEQATYRLTRVLPQLLHLMGQKSFLLTSASKRWDNTVAQLNNQLTFKMSDQKEIARYAKLLLEGLLPLLKEATEPQNYHSLKSLSPLLKTMTLYLGLSYSALHEKEGELDIETAALLKEIRAKVVDLDIEDLAEIVDGQLFTTLKNQFTGYLQKKINSPNFQELLEGMRIIDWLPKPLHNELLREIDHIQRSMKKSTISTVTSSKNPPLRSNLDKVHDAGSSLAGTSNVLTQSTRRRVTGAVSRNSTGGEGGENLTGLAETKQQDAKRDSGKDVFKKSSLPKPAITPESRDAPGQPSSSIPPASTSPAKPSEAREAMDSNIANAPQTTSPSSTAEKGNARVPSGDSKEKQDLYSSDAVVNHFKQANSFTETIRLFKTALFPLLRTQASDLAIEAGFKSLLDHWTKLKDAGKDGLITAWKEMAELKPDPPLQSAFEEALLATKKKMLNLVCGVDDLRTSQEKRVRLFTNVLPFLLDLFAKDKKQDTGLLQQWNESINQLRNAVKDEAIGGGIEYLTDRIDNDLLPLMEKAKAENVWDLTLPGFTNLLSTCTYNLGQAWGSGMKSDNPVSNYLEAIKSLKHIMARISKFENDDLILQVEDIFEIIKAGLLSKLQKKSEESSFDIDASLESLRKIDWFDGDIQKNFLLDLEKIKKEHLESLVNSKLRDTLRKIVSEAERAALKIHQNPSTLGEVKSKFVELSTLFKGLSLSAVPDIYLKGLPGSASKKLQNLSNAIKDTLIRKVETLQEEILKSTNSIATMTPDQAELYDKMLNQWLKSESALRADAKDIGIDFSKLEKALEAYREALGKRKAEIKEQQEQLKPKLGKESKDDDDIVQAEAKKEQARMNSDSKEEVDDGNEQELSIKKQLEQIKGAIVQAESTIGFLQSATDLQPAENDYKRIVTQLAQAASTASDDQKVREAVENAMQVLERLEHSYTIFKQRSQEAEKKQKAKKQLSAELSSIIGQTGVLNAPRTVEALAGVKSIIEELSKSLEGIRRRMTGVDADAELNQKYIDSATVIDHWKKEITKIEENVVREADLLQGLGTKISDLDVTAVKDASTYADLEKKFLSLRDEAVRTIDGVENGLMVSAQIEALKGIIIKKEEELRTKKGIMDSAAQQDKKVQEQREQQQKEEARLKEEEARRRQLEAQAKKRLMEKNLEDLLSRIKSTAESLEKAPFDHVKSYQSNLDEFKKQATDLKTQAQGFDIDFSRLESDLISLNEALIRKLAEVKKQKEQEQELETIRNENERLKNWIEQELKNLEEAISSIGNNPVAFDHASSLYSDIANLIMQQITDVDLDANHELKNILEAAAVKMDVMKTAIDEKRLELNSNDLQLIEQINALRFEISNLDLNDLSKARQNFKALKDEIVAITAQKMSTVFQEPVDELLGLLLRESQELYTRHCNSSGDDKKAEKSIDQKKSEEEAKNLWSETEELVVEHLVAEKEWLAKLLDGEFQNAKEAEERKIKFDTSLPWLRQMVETTMDFKLNLIDELKKLRIELDALPKAMEEKINDAKTKIKAKQEAEALKLEQSRQARQKLPEQVNQEVAALEKAIHNFSLNPKLAWQKYTRLAAFVEAERKRATQDNDAELKTILEEAEKIIQRLKLTIIEKQRSYLTTLIEEATKLTGHLTFAPFSDQCNSLYLNVNKKLDEATSLASDDAGVSKKIREVEQIRFSLNQAFEACKERTERKAMELQKAKEAKAKQAEQKAKEDAAKASKAEEDRKVIEAAAAAKMAQEGQKAKEDTAKANKAQVEQTVKAAATQAKNLEEEQAMQMIEIEMVDRLENRKTELAKMMITGELKSLQDVEDNKALFDSAFENLHDLVVTAETALKNQYQIRRLDSLKDDLFEMSAEMEQRVNNEIARLNAQAKKAAKGAKLQKDLQSLVPQVQRLISSLPSMTPADFEQKSQTLQDLIKQREALHAQGQAVQALDKLLSNATAGIAQKKAEIEQANAQAKELSAQLIPLEAELKEIQMANCMKLTRLEELKITLDQILAAVKQKVMAQEAVKAEVITNCNQLATQIETKIQQFSQAIQAKGSKIHDKVDGPTGLLISKLMKRSLAGIGVKEEEYLESIVNAWLQRASFGPDPAYEQGRVLLEAFITWLKEQKDIAHAHGCLRSLAMDLTQLKQQ